MGAEEGPNAPGRPLSPSETAPQVKASTPLMQRLIEMFSSDADPAYRALPQNEADADAPQSPASASQLADYPELAVPQQVPQQPVDVLPEQNAPSPPSPEADERLTA